MMAPPRQKSMAMGAPMKKGIDTALGSGTNFLYGRGTTKSCGHTRWLLCSQRQSTRSQHVCNLHQIGRLRLEMTNGVLNK